MFSLRKNGTAPKKVPVVSVLTRDLWERQNHALRTTKNHKKPGQNKLILLVNILEIKILHFSLSSKFVHIWTQKSTSKNETQKLEQERKNRFL